MNKHPRLYGHIWSDGEGSITKEELLYTALCVWCRIYVRLPDEKEDRDSALAVKAFAKEIGIPTFLILDLEGTHRSDELRTVTNGMNCLWANLAELYIGLIKESICKDMKDSNSLPNFWDYCAERWVLINNLTSEDLFLVHGSNVNEKITD